MKTSLFSFELPEELIAQEPPRVRGTSRLMLISRTGPLQPKHRSVSDLPDLIEPGTLMVFNDTRVRKARVYGVNTETGGRGGFLFLTPVNGGGWDCLVDKARKKKAGQKWSFPGGITGIIGASPAPDRRIISLNPEPDESWFEHCGHIPLPPYMRREDHAGDDERYQTVYARQTGSAAAPTAGLHFTPQIISGLEQNGVETAWVTLQVGLGTFAPVRSDVIQDHPMHSETYNVSEQAAAQIRRAKSERRPVLAVGTTAVRTLEASWDGDGPRPGGGSTELFIYPGYEFRVVDQIFTNFHTPCSSLMMLVSAFCGRERLLKSYEEAVREQYHFFSYGDAMLIRQESEIVSKNKLPEFL